MTKLLRGAAQGRSGSGMGCETLVTGRPKAVRRPVSIPGVVRAGPSTGADVACRVRLGAPTGACRTCIRQSHGCERSAPSPGERLRLDPGGPVHVALAVPEPTF